MFATAKSSPALKVSEAVQQPSREASEIVGSRPSHLMVGDSPQMREVFDQIRKFAATDLPVIITGESGTGKELVGRAIHQRSRRSRMPYVALNCAAVPATLMASELFGYERGAFTGANTRKLGHVEHANGGSLFLDEIGDMPLDLQLLLLRFLQEGEILRVGGRDPIKIDARVIAATNVTLRDAIETGKLREDLYYRLNVLTLHLPPCATGREMWNYWRPIVCESSHESAHTNCADFPALQ